VSIAWVGLFYRSINSERIWAPTLGQRTPTADGRNEATAPLGPDAMRCIRPSRSREAKRRTDTEVAMLGLCAA
jgi:hypothetical protein